MNEANSSKVINVMKDVFSRHGTPSELITDNGSQYKSSQFRKFAKECDFEHNTSSPRYPQSNGLAESSVKTVKKMMKKCINTGKDIKKGLLAIRNTPLSCGSSPAELLMNRQLNDGLPRLPETLNTKKPPRRNLVAERQKQIKHHDNKILRKQTNPETFTPGQKVALQHHSTKEWSIRGTIVKEVAPRSFDVLTSNNTTLRRNRRQLRKLHSTTSSIFTRHNGRTR